VLWKRPKLPSENAVEQRNNRGLMMECGVKLPGMAMDACFCMGVSALRKSNYILDDVVEELIMGMVDVL
jgi:hypothetical protein